MKKVLVLIALIALMVAGTALSVQGTVAEEESPELFVDYVASAYGGCTNFCSWCVPYNGNGGCTYGGACC